MIVDWEALTAEFYAEGDKKRTGRPKKPAKLHKVLQNPPYKGHNTVAYHWQQEIARMRAELIGDKDDSTSSD